MLTTLRVVEIDGSVAGGYAGKLLADHGTAVTKVVGRGHGSPGWTPGMRLALDRTKSIVEAVDDRNLVDLLSSADIVIQSSSPDRLASVFDRSARALALAADRRRISVEISPFGSAGPYADRRSTDLTDQAISGHLYLNGDPDREPLRGPDHQVAYAAGTHAAIGALAAVRARALSGRGQRVEVSHHQVMVALHQFTLLRYTHNGDILTRMGNRYAGPGHPAGIYRCGSGFLSLIAPRGDQLESLLAVTGLDHLIEDPEIDGIYGLMHHPTLLDEHLVPWLAERDPTETIELFQALRIPAGPVSTMADVLADEHLSDRRAWHHHVVDGREIRTPRRACHISRLGGQADADSDSDGGDDVADAGPAAPDGLVPPADGPLTGLRVLDLTRVWAGPYSTRILADLGADVIMVEAPWARGGATIDEVSVAATRFYPDNEPGERHWNRIGFANKFNINKRNIAIDLGGDAGLGLLEALIASADVLVENYSPRVMPNFGLDEARLRQLNPSLIYVTMPGFGRTGPSRDRVAYGPTIDSQAGLSVLMGYAGERARKAGVAWPDPVVGMHAALATIAAVLERADSGGGRTVEVAQIEATVAMVGHALAEAQLSGAEPAPHGNRDPAMAPHGVYPCLGEDRWIAVAVTDDAGWAGLCAAANLDETWPGWSLRQRHRNHDLIDRALAAWTSSADQGDLVTRFQEVGVAAAPVADAPQVLADPHLEAEGFFVSLDHPEAGRHPWPRLAIELSETPATYRRPGPTLNQHGAEILSEVVGLDEAEIAELERRGVVADRPPD